MKDEDIKLPKMISLVNSMSWNNDIEEYARQAVRMNIPASKPSDPEPFDLARAMSGEPIVTRDGRKARFVAYVPEATVYKLVVFVDGEAVPSFIKESGRRGGEGEDRIYDLFMAPKPKRTVWVNVWIQENGVLESTRIPYASKSAAENSALANSCISKYITIAHPIEIED